jgi:sRNA-binding carbon storage regulator CsrA
VIKVGVAQIRENAVRLGVEAGEVWSIVREELDVHPIQPENVDEIGLRSETT